MRTHLLQKLSFWIALLLIISSCYKKTAEQNTANAITLEELKESGELVVLTLSGSTSYFIYRGNEMGYQYELSNQFAESLGLKKIGRAHV